ncbi:Bacterial membrane protein YfhO [Mariniflexile rhizosphaerae]|uniref:YfhO family protein n=1 Tax=unclassified Mariniflexile TaxID=2643887 RepID=UPI000CAA5E39|nr:YfhO family protein [Mariniflexile sp. TRM1-10]AXP82411.1 Bacterial membrane protein YfhO [Mariniflexile sp. TRM1-10]PLB17700.1 MAG: Membrane protein [Flavobacteriaceae bacterium FS1-H7996/R]
MQFSIKKLLPHVLVVLGFIIISLAYFNPVLKGKQIFQSDIMQYIGMSKQQNDFRAETGEETYWTNSAFAGMPTYQLGAKYPHNYIKKLDLTLRFLPRPADYLFLYLLGFYILLLVLKVDFKLATIGALAFGFSTYLIIILGVGHNSKAHAIAYMPLVLSGILLTFQKRYIAGFLLTTIAMGLELVANHFQMTYYLMLLVLVLGVAYLIDAYKKKELPHYFKTIGLLTVAVILSIALNATNVLATQEYVKESTRGKSELTINPDGSPKEATSGLDKDYITQFSYGFAETFNLFIPRFMGGGNGEDVGKDSATYEAFRKLGATTTQAAQEAKRAPMYWGDQPIVEAPAYIGAVVLFLFVFALFLVKGRLKWWLVGGSVMSLLLSYGKNLGFLTDFFIDYVPMYNKFRAVTSIQVILELCIPVLAIFGLVRLFNDFEKKEEKLKALKYSAIITGGLALVFLLFKSSLFDFVGANDGFYRQSYGEAFVDALREDRRTIFTNDTIRTLILVLLSAGAIYMYLQNKLKEKWVVVAFGALILFDLVGVDRRYVNNDDFVSAIQVNKPFEATEVDNYILKDTGYYRVFDLVGGAAKPSYFHNSLNGYNAAELKRYSELFDFYIVKNNINVLNMLNTKYIIAQDKDGNLFPYKNDEANGHAWFVKELKRVDSANEEIKVLDSLDNKNVAVFDNSDFGSYYKSSEIPKFKVDSLASIKLIEHKPNYLKYQSNNSNKGFAVFSEIYYGNGWKTFIDGKETTHIRVNYTLRGMEIPAGKHTIEFKFDPDVVKTGSSIALASSILVGLLLLGGLFYEFKKKSGKGA